MIPSLKWDRREDQPARSMPAMKPRSAKGCGFIMWGNREPAQKMEGWGEDRPSLPERHAMPLRSPAPAGMPAYFSTECGARGRIRRSAAVLTRQDDDAIRDSGRYGGSGRRYFPLTGPASPCPTIEIHHYAPYTPPEHYLDVTRPSATHRRNPWTFFRTEVHSGC